MSTQKQSFDEIISDVEALLAHEKLKSYDKKEALNALIKLIKEFSQSWLKPAHTYWNASLWEAPFNLLKDIEIKNETDFRFALILYTLLQIFNPEHCHQALDCHQYLDDYLPPAIKANILAIPKRLFEAMEVYSLVDGLFDEKLPRVIQKTLLSFHAKVLLTGTVEKNTVVVDNFSPLIYQLIKCDNDRDLQPGQIRLYLRGNQVCCRFKSQLGLDVSDFILKQTMAEFSQENFIDEYRESILGELKKNEKIQFLTPVQSSLLIKLGKIVETLNFEERNILTSSKRLGLFGRVQDWWSPIPVDSNYLKSLNQICTQIFKKKETLNEKLLFINYLFQQANFYILKQQEKLTELEKNKENYVTQKKLLDQLQDLLKIHQGITTKISELIADITRQSSLFLEQNSFQDQSFLQADYTREQLKVLPELGEIRDNLNASFDIFCKHKINFLKKIASTSFNQYPQRSLAKHIFKIAASFALASASILGLIYSDTLVSTLAIHISLAWFQLVLVLALAFSLRYLYISVCDYPSHQAEIAPVPNNLPALSTTP